MDVGFTPIEERRTPWKLETGAGRRRKPAVFEHADIPAAKTAPLEPCKDSLGGGSAGGPRNTDGGSDVECMDVVRRVTETPLAPDRDIDSRGARVSSIPRSRTSDDSGPRPPSPRSSPSGSPTSCPAAGPAASVTNGALSSASGSPSGSPRVGEGGGAGGIPSVGAGGGTSGQKNSLAGPIYQPCLLYTSPSPRDKRQSRMPSSA